MSSSLQDLKPTFLELFLKAWSEGKCHAWWKCVIKAGSLSGRPDFLSLLSHLCNKDEERSLLFILVLLLVSIYVLGSLIPPWCSGAAHSPCSGAPAPRVPPAGPWLGFGGRTVLSSGHMNWKSLLAFVPVPWGSLWLCCMGLGEPSRGFSGVGFLGERSRAEKVCF